jgi:hypothetical protein
MSTITHETRAQPGEQQYRVALAVKVKRVFRVTLKNLFNAKDEKDVSTGLGNPEERFFVGSFCRARSVEH